MTTALEHVYTPHGAAAELMAARDPEVLLAGPAGTGKSRACLEKLHLMALLNPGLAALIVRKTAVSLTSTALVTWQRHVATEAIEHGHVHYYGGSRQEPAGYRYTNGSRIDLGGMDKPTKIMSSEYDVVFVQEAIELTEDDWEKLTTRLRNGVVSFQQLIGDTNPDRPTHWLKRRCDSGQTRMIDCRHTDNPLYWDHDTEQWTDAGRDYLDKLGRLTSLRRARLLDGKWEGAEGLVWPNWHEPTHLIDPFPIPDHWARYWSIDFGYTNPFVCQWWAVDDDGRLHRYRELYMTQRLVETHAATILEQVTDDGQWVEPKPVEIICDHDAEGRATLERHLGLRTSSAHKAVAEGVQAVEARLTKAGDGHPRLYLHRGALVEVDRALADAAKPTCTEQEIPGYVWPTVKDGKPELEHPVKVDDHGCDTTRYMVAHLDCRRTGTRVRFL